MMGHHAAGSGTITNDEALEFLALARRIDRLQPKAVLGRRKKHGGAMLT